MIAVTARNLWAHRRRLVATLLAVGLGVAFLAGTLLSDTLRANFDRLFTQADGGTDVVLRGATEVGSSSGPGGTRTGVDASLRRECGAVTARHPGRELGRRPRPELLPAGGGPRAAGRGPG